MKKASTYVIFALVVCAVPWISQALEEHQKCVYRSDGKQSGEKMSDDGEIPMDQGPIVRIFVPGTENLKVVGSNIIFCDDQEFKIELADDKRNYIVYRKDDSLNPSCYLMTVYYVNETGQEKRKNLRPRRLH